MKELLTFGIELSFLTIVFYVGFLIIRNNTTPTFKRFYLLVWLISSIAFPLIEVEFEQSHKVGVSQLIEEQTIRPVPMQEKIENFQSRQMEDQNWSYYSDVKDKQTEEDSNAKVDWISVLKIGYGMVTLFFLIRILLGVFQIVKMRFASTRSKSGIHLIDDPKFKGASFFKWVFIGASLEQDTDIIVKHERMHSRLWHSADILLSHFYCALLWANPLSWILKKQIAINTELEADFYMIQSTDRSGYANLLLSMSAYRGQTMMNHFGAFHLKSRIKALAKNVSHKKWVSLFSATMLSTLFFLVSCESINSSEVMVERMGDVKTITTRFVSHQSDTQQKTGKIVAIASFGPDGALEELVEQTTYPYDREFEVKKVFWDAPEKMGIPFVMDGLSLGGAEKSFLYGNDWPKAYYKHLVDKSKSADGFMKENISTDSELLPSEILRTREYEDNEYIVFGFPDITEYYEYDEGKVLNVYSKADYQFANEDDKKNKSMKIVSYKSLSKEEKDFRKQMVESSGKKQLVSTYTYEGDLVTGIKWGETERKFYYENKLLVKSEYIKKGEVINTRLHFYKNSLKDRTEIFNRYNEPEYTITYEYAFW